VAVRAATGLSELMVLAFVPSLLLPVLSPTVGQSYAVSDALIHATCLFIAGSVFFSLTFLLSSMFDSVWPPLLIVLCAATLMSLAERLSPQIARYGLFHIVGAESYYRGEGLPLVGLVVTALASAAMLYGAAMNIARRDF
jgi:hypothetical protein